MWPMVLDYSTEDCKIMLRSLELEAYSAVVSALRAQGELTKEKKQVLLQLSRIFSVTPERHQAEIRRAANDEKLNTIAYSICRENTYNEWIAEGRRLVPLVPRAVPQSAMTSIANAAANVQASKNENLPSGVFQARPSTEPTRKPSVNKRKRSEKNSDHLERTKVVTTSANAASPNASSSKTTKVASSSKAVVSNSQPATLSTLPRVVFMSTSATGLRTLAVTQAPTSNFVTTTTTGSAIEAQFAKARIVAANVDPAATAANVSTSGTGSSSGTNAKVFTTKSFPQQLVVFPGSSQQKAITIPISQPLKIAQSSATTTLVYQGSPATIKSGPATFTIQTFKPAQSTAKIQGSNVIIMPAKAAVGQAAKPIATLVASNAKGLTRQVSQKEIKVVNSETPKEEKLAAQTVNNKAPNNVIEIQTSGAVLQNIMKSGQLNKDLIDLVHKAVKTSTSTDPLASVKDDVPIETSS